MFFGLGTFLKTAWLQLWGDNNKEHLESVLKFGKEEEIPELRRLSESAQLEEEKLHNTDSQMSGSRRPLFNRQTPFLDDDAMTPGHISDAKTN